MQISDAAIRGEQKQTKKTKKKTKNRKKTKKKKRQRPENRPKKNTKTRKQTKNRQKTALFRANKHLESLSYHIVVSYNERIAPLCTRSTALGRGGVCHEMQPVTLKPFLSPS